MQPQRIHNQINSQDNLYNQQDSKKSYQQQSNLFNNKEYTTGRSSITPDNPYFNNQFNDGYRNTFQNQIDSNTIQNNRNQVQNGRQNNQQQNYVSDDFYNEIYQELNKAKDEVFELLQRYNTQLKNKKNCVSQQQRSFLKKQFKLDAEKVKLLYEHLQDSFKNQFERLNDLQQCNNQPKIQKKSKIEEDLIMFKTLIEEFIDKFNPNKNLINSLNTTQQSQSQQGQEIKNNNTKYQQQFPQQTYTGNNNNNQYNKQQNQNINNDYQIHQQYNQNSQKNNNNTLNLTELNNISNINQYNPKISNLTSVNDIFNNPNNNGKRQSNLNTVQEEQNYQNQNYNTQEVISASQNQNYTNKFQNNQLENKQYRMTEMIDRKNYEKDEFQNRYSQGYTKQRSVTQNSGSGGKQIFQKQDSSDKKINQLQKHLETSNFNINPQNNEQYKFQSQNANIYNNNQAQNLNQQQFTLEFYFCPFCNKKIPEKQFTEHVQVCDVLIQDLTQIGSPDKQQNKDQYNNNYNQNQIQEQEQQQQLQEKKPDYYKIYQQSAYEAFLEQQQEYFQNISPKNQNNTTFTFPGNQSILSETFYNASDLNLIVRKLDDKINMIIKNIEQNMLKNNFNNQKESKSSRILKECLEDLKNTLIKKDAQTMQKTMFQLEKNLKGIEKENRGFSNPKKDTTYNIYIYLKAVQKVLSERNDRSAMLMDITNFSPKKEIKNNNFNQNNNYNMQNQFILSDLNEDKKIQNQQQQAQNIPYQNSNQQQQQILSKYSPPSIENSKKYFSPTNPQLDYKYTYAVPYQIQDYNNIGLHKNYNNLQQNSSKSQQSSPQNIKQQNLNKQENTKPSQSVKLNNQNNHLLSTSQSTQRFQGIDQFVNSLEAKNNLDKKSYDPTHLYSIFNNSNNLNQSMQDINQKSKYQQQSSNNQKQMSESLQQNKTNYQPYQNIEKQVYNSKLEFFEIAKQIRDKLPEQHPGRKVLVSEIYNEVISNNIPISKWKLYIEDQLYLAQ